MMRLVDSSLKPHAQNDIHHETVKTLRVSLLMLILLVAVVILIGQTPRAITHLLYSLMGFLLIVLLMTPKSSVRPWGVALALGLPLTSAAIVFNLNIVSLYDVYMLTTFHMLSLIITALFSYKRRYVSLSTAAVIATVLVHYFFRELPSNQISPLMSPGLDDHIICSVLLWVTAIIIKRAIKTQTRLLSSLQRTSAENKVKAEQLSLINTNLRKIMAEQEEIKEKYILLLENATDAIFIAQDGLIKFSNKRTVDMFGYTRQELFSMSMTDFIHPEDQARVIRRHLARLNGENPKNNYTFRGIDNQKQLRWLKLHVVSTMWEGKRATLNFIQDITGQKRMEHQVQQSQKMEAIGTLAGGIAHDFNNILSGIFAYLQLAQNHADNPEKIKKYMKSIRMGAQKAADLSRQILTISRKSEPIQKPVILSDIAKEVIGLMRATLPPTIEIQENLKGRTAILADPGKIHQVIMNLCTNAFHAMIPSGGTLCLRLEPISVHRDPELEGTGIPSGEYLCLSVKDTGKGMDHHIREKIFDPYFTTKAPGKGTGLGLAVTLGIIEEHQGHIRVASQPGRGATFHVYLPVPQSLDQTIAAPEPESICPEPGKEKGKILLVDDEPSVCQATQKLLENQGYQVTCCTNGQDAWQQFKSDPNGIDLIFTDHVMPRMSGAQLIQKVTALSPDTPTILCTGNTEMIAGQENFNAWEFLPKPLDTTLLLSTIHNLLAKEEA